MACGVPGGCVRFGLAREAFGQTGHVLVPPAVAAARGCWLSSVLGIRLLMVPFRE